MMCAELVNKPDFLIIGAAKSGTTSLYAYLRSHPEVFMPEMKELNYFAPTHPFGIHDPQSYSEALAPGRAYRIVGEASPAYLSSPESPQLIHEALGESVKLVVLLRNPADMMYSHWAHCVRDAHEARDARTALLESFDAPWNPGKWYLHHAERARYAKQLRRYYALFPAANIKVYLYEEFFVSGFPLFTDLCRFLGVDDFIPETSEKFNKGYMPRFRWLHRFINVHYGHWCLPVVSKIVPTVLRNRVRAKLDSWNSVGHGAVPAMHTELRRELEARLNNDVRSLEELLGRDLSSVWF